jgi:hypothetical protein
MPLIPVSVGELVDKLTILDIKLARLADAGKLAHARRERDLLQAALDRCLPALGEDLSALRAELEAVNAALWDVEDALREKERAGAFDDAFIALARSVYQRNDHRARVKLEINRRCGSGLVEVKSYV